MVERSEGTDDEDMGKGKGPKMNKKARKLEKKEKLAAKVSLFFLW